MKYKFKLREDLEFGVGDTSNTHGIKSTVSGVDQETNSVEWDIDYEFDFGTMLKSIVELELSYKAAFNETKDSYFKDLEKKANLMKNSLRLYMRKKYPEIYKKFKNLDEMSSSGGAGAYNSKYFIKGDGKK